MLTSFHCVIWCWSITNALRWEQHYPQNVSLKVAYKRELHVRTHFAMELTFRDFNTLSRAADIADAQSELMELTKHQSEQRTEGQWQSDAGVLAAMLVVIFVITVASLTQTLASDTFAYNGTTEQQVVVLN
jgi:hypothetical protein